jgi:predicted component of type VI protein secretion system
VSARHCEIVLDRRLYVVCDHSRYGTFVNDHLISQQVLHSGDWIRLGPQGPLLRFLGQPAADHAARR